LDASTAIRLALLESFLRSRGNLRDMERELGISYPTVRGRVEALVRALGLGPAADADASEADLLQAATARATDVAAERRRVLERLSRHEIPAEDAAALLRALGDAPKGTTTARGGAVSS